MIRLARAEDLTQVKALWMRAFHDAKEATDFYFENRMPLPALLDNLLIDTEDGVLRGMLSLLPLQLAVNGRRYAARYFFAIATDERFRRQGISSALIEEAKRLTLKRGGHAALLVPASGALFDFYGKRGFETLFVYEEKMVSAGDIPPRPEGARLWRADSASDVLALREAAFRGSGVFASWDEEALGFVIRASEAWDAPFLRFSSGGGEGYAYCEREGDTAFVKELALHGIGLNDALAIIHSEIGAARYKLRLMADRHTDKSSLRPYGMIAWLKPPEGAPAPDSAAPYLGFGKD